MSMKDTLARYLRSERDALLWKPPDCPSTTSGGP